MESYPPYVVVCSIASTKTPKDLIRQIVGVDELSSPVPVIENIEAYPWHIDTKYYTADIQLCSLQSKTIACQAFAESVQAAVIIFDSSEEAGLQIVEGWLPFIREFEPEIQMLVCDRCTSQVAAGDSSSGITKLQAQEWCLNHGFELVELDPSDDSDPEDEDDFRETTGIKRIIQSLHAHTWPNLIMKDRHIAVSEKLRNILNAEASSMSPVEETLTDAPLGGPSAEAAAEWEVDERQSGAADGKNNRTEVNSQITREEIIDSLVDKDSDILNAFVAADEEPSFEHLFEQFLRMKETAQALPAADRKMYAEKVAVAFWRAMGGDEEEVSRLDAEEDET